MVSDFEFLLPENTEIEMVGVINIESLNTTDEDAGKRSLLWIRRVKLFR